MILAVDLGVGNLKARSDSLLITRQVTWSFTSKDEMLIRYLKIVQQVKLRFKSFELTHVPWEPNSRADILAKLASTKKSGKNRAVVPETIPQPTISEAQVLLVETEPSD